MQQGTLLNMAKNLKFDPEICSVADATQGAIIYTYRTTEITVKTSPWRFARVCRLVPMMAG